MNKISTTALILIAIALVYFFRDKLRNLIAPQTVINITPQGNSSSPCNCTQTQPTQSPASTDNTTPLEDGFDDELDLSDVLNPSSGDWSSGAVPYNLNANTIY